MNDKYNDTVAENVSNRTYNAISFDMNGTLLNTHIDYDKLVDAGRYVLHKLGMPNDQIIIGNDNEMIGDGVKYLNNHGCVITSDDVYKLINARALEIEMESINTTECYPGVPEMLKILKYRGYRLGLLTGGQRNYTEMAMKKCGILHYMDAIEAFDDHPAGEQKPNPIAMVHLASKLGVKCSEILHVGDCVWDYYCAINSGADFIGVTTGENHTRWENAGGHVTTVDNVTDILKNL
ncbi:MAG: HAD family hydrolase [archaeon]|nr:HAD family hydrolase [archaeon]